MPFLKSLGIWFSADTGYTSVCFVVLKATLLLWLEKLFVFRDRFEGFGEY